MSDRVQDLVEEATIRLADLEITISVRRAPQSSQSSGYPQVQASPVQLIPPSPADYFETYPISYSQEERALRARTAAECSLVLPDCLRHLIPRLRSSDEQWTAEARLGRAFRAGVVARRRLGGEDCDLTSPSVPFKNGCYICLRGPGNSVGFWTSSYHWNIQEGRSGTGLNPASIFHAFASHTEAAAYLAGARRPWPEKRE